jgi:hypothetical protein
MKNHSDQNQLLNDVLSESEEFREAMLGETLRYVRNRRRTRRLWRVSPALLVGALFAWHFIPTHPAAEKPAQRSVVITATAPLDPAAVIHTRPLATKLMISSTPSVYFVHTRSSGENFLLISDGELMALAAPRPTVLMRLGPDSQMLIFADGNDVTEFRRN